MNWQLLFQILPKRVTCWFDELQEQSNRHSNHVGIDDLLKSGDSTKNLGDLTKSLDTLRKFSDEVLAGNATRKQVARTWIEHEAWKWAKSGLDNAKQIVAEAKELQSTSEKNGKNEQANKM
jgi:hypothetical protein